MKHTIADVIFIPGDDAGSPIVCACGWIGIVAEWRAHRGPLEASRYKMHLRPVPKP